MEMIEFVPELKHGQQHVYNLIIFSIVPGLFSYCWVFSKEEQSPYAEKTNDPY